MKTNDHVDRIRESLEEIRMCIKNGIERHQRTIGFHISAAMVDLLEAYLHENSMIDPGTVFKHEWFASAKVRERLPEFENKEKILNIMNEIESERNKLCYGKKQDRETISKVIERFHVLKDIFAGMGVGIEKE